MTGYFKLRRIVLEQLKNGLPKNLTYHDVNHVLDVLGVCNQYIKRFKIEGTDAYLLRIGALVHDLGFTKSTQNHEEVGAEMAQNIMESLKMDPAHIETVKGLVMATKIPQNPKTDLQKIICDSDLDYLGRKDYVEISGKLYQELKSTNVIKTREDWVELQIRFLNSHTFHTEFARKNREPKKQFWLNYILKNENY
ncbi:HD domain-containing protein [Aquiflexum gelatinilyticum]|uniref:HD domain-containing protein n=1 Tax=Aquiflexum gelatinilyticum TaxID=2961943 RepID=A0A9X2SYG8_9BACT|nr:HD domain-containing protein [Aquiflexum gelatinilyticum]MCR9015124.1 HD domain-containing protein [Aquiflexum gelatinilyticum]MCS4433939.1 HD domain-containing protein [Aquiflexum gelatinilyticum]